MRPGAAMTILVNMSVFDDAPYCRKLGLPVPPLLADPRATRFASAEAGLAVTRIDPNLPEPPWRTSWGQKLVRGSARRILQIDAVMRPADIPSNPPAAITPPDPAAGSAMSG